MERKKIVVLAGCVGFVLVLAAMLLITTPGEAQTKGSQNKILKIGCLLSTTGWHTVIDAVDGRNLKIMATIINEKGGITVKGERYNIELLVEDTKSTMDGVRAAATRLVFDKKVKFVVGPNSFFTPGATPVLEPNKVLHVSGYNVCQPNELDANTPYGFLANIGSIGIAMVGIRAIQAEFPDVKKVIFSAADDGALPYLTPKIKMILELNGYTMLDTIGLPNEIVDFSPIAVKFNAIKDADAILHINGAPTTMGNSIKALRELGNTIPYVTAIDGDSNDLLSLVGKDATNVVCGGIAPNAPDNPPMIKEIWNRGGKQPPLFAFTSSALWLLAQAIEAADSLDPTVVRDKWESMDKVDTIYGPGVMCGEKTYGIKNHAVSHPYSYTKIMDGKVSYGGWRDIGAIP